MGRVAADDCDRTGQLGRRIRDDLAEEVVSPAGLFIAPLVQMVTMKQAIEGAEWLVNDSGHRVHFEYDPRPEDPRLPRP